MNIEPGESEHLIPVPVFDENSSIIEYISKNLDIDDLFIELAIANEFHPNTAPFEVLRQFFNSDKEICPTSLVDPYLTFLIEAEHASREYHTLPFDGGLWDQPLQLIEVFNSIATERNRFDRQRIEKLTKSTKKGKPAMGSSESGLPPRQGNLNG